MTTSALDGNKAGNADLRAAGHDFGSKGSGHTSEPVSRAGGPLPGKIEGIGIRELAHEVVALCDALETAEEAICNFAEQRNEAMREVDRLLESDAAWKRNYTHVCNALEVAQADIERAADRADVLEARLHGVTRDFSTIRASRDEACGLLREARAEIVRVRGELAGTTGRYHHVANLADRALSVAERGQTYTDEQRAFAADELLRFPRPLIEYDRQLQVDAIASALGMRRAGE